MKQKQSGYLLLIPAALLAIVVVFSLLFLMQALINANLEEPEEREVFSIDDIWQEEIEITEERRDNRVTDIDEAELPPELPPMTVAFDDNVNMGGIGTEVAPVEIQIDGGSFSDGDMIALVRVNPEYPIRAAERGLEGFCTVYFTVTTAGTTKDAHVQPGPEQCSNSLFERPSIRAIERFRFRPKMIDGAPVEVQHANRFIFELEE